MGVAASAASKKDLYHNSNNNNNMNRMSAYCQGSGDAAKVEDLLRKIQTLEQELNVKEKEISSLQVRMC